MSIASIIVIIIGCMLLGIGGLLVALVNKVKKPLFDGVDAVSVYAEGWSDSAKTNVQLRKLEQEAELIDRITEINKKRTKKGLAEIDMSSFGLVKKKANK